MLTVLIVLVMVALAPSAAAEGGDFPGRPDFVASRDFSWKSLSEPENLFWLAYFWYWNGPPTPDVLRQQLADMAGHDARSVCVVPMPHAFRPVTMNTSMDVDYLSPEFFQRVKVPETLRGGRLVLDLGHVEYAVRVRVDGQHVGCVLWRPWRLELPSLAGRSEFELEITVASTLANELTSQRAGDAWSKRKGPGWPGPYHERELAFETESRGGGLLGPVRLQLATP